MMNCKYKRGSLYYANLSPVVGCEQDGERPVVIIQNNKGNKCSPTVIVAVLSCKTNKSYLPTHYVIKGRYKLKKSVIYLEHIRTIDKRRLCNYIGKLTKKELKEVNKKLCVSLGIK